MSVMDSTGRYELTAPCGFCQGDGVELAGAHSVHERWIPCTHCGGHGYGLTREQAEDRASRTNQPR